MCSYSTNIPKINKSQYGPKQEFTILVITKQSWPIMVMNKNIKTIIIQKKLQYKKTNEEIDKLNK